MSFLLWENFVYKSLFSQSVDFVKKSINLSKKTIIKTIKLSKQFLFVYLIKESKIETLQTTYGHLQNNNLPNDYIGPKLPIWK